MKNKVAIEIAEGTNLHNLEIEKRQIVQELDSARRGMPPCVITIKGSWSCHNFHQIR